MKDIMVYSRFISEAKHNHAASQNIKAKAQELRKKMTGPEQILWSYLRNRQMQGMYFRRQHPYGIYILDFYCFEANLAIEIDGLIHLKSMSYDLERTEYLKSTGLNVIRFTNKDIENRISWVLENLNKVLENLPPSNQPS